jgi:hypothetical protein
LPLCISFVFCDWSYHVASNYQVRNPP